MHSAIVVLLTRIERRGEEAATELGGKYGIINGKLWGKSENIAVSNTRSEM